MIFSECEHHFCGWLHPRVCIIVRTVLTSIFSTSWRNLKLTDSSASCGHSWNQSIAVQFTTAEPSVYYPLERNTEPPAVHTHAHTHTHTHTARSNRIECEVWYSSEIIVILFLCEYNSSHSQLWKIQAGNSCSDYHFFMVKRGEWESVN